jgi:hypothetical protein
MVGLCCGCGSMMCDGTRTAWRHGSMRWCVTEHSHMFGGWQRPWGAPGGVHSKQPPLIEHLDVDATNPLVHGFTVLESRDAISALGFGPPSEARHAGT